MTSSERQGVIVWSALTALTTLTLTIQSSYEQSSKYVCTVVSLPAPLTKHRCGCGLSNLIFDSLNAIVLPVSAGQTVITPVWDKERLR